MKNLGTIGEDGQRRLLASHVAVVGAGGLGGVVIEILARYGVGRITAVDFDSFEETNLNRQLLSTEGNLGEKKAHATARRIAEINSEIEAIAVAERLTDANAEKILGGCDIACDCLGNIRDRFILQRATRELGIPMVHAAIAGERGQVMTIMPGGPGLSAIYGDESEAPKSGIEVEAGTPPSSVFAVASLQAHEAMRILAGIGAPLRNEILRIDLSGWKVDRLSVNP
jgi:molybdopterin/thiamine biosynthesis adenylyltransferase